MQSSLNPGLFQGIVKDLINISLFAIDCQPLSVFDESKNMLRPCFQFSSKLCLSSTPSNIFQNGKLVRATPASASPLLSRNECM
jgi:hypothetical protein